MKPLRLRAVKPGKKLGDADFGALALAHGPRSCSHAALDTAKPTDRPAFEQPKDLDPAIALRATEQAPRPAVRKLAQHEANREVGVPEPYDPRCAVRSDLA
jgi:hypothetical protein